MTKKEREELNKAVLGEFLSQEESEMRKMFREMRRFVDAAVEEGFTRAEAIHMIIEIGRPR